VNSLKNNKGHTSNLEIFQAFFTSNIREDNDYLFQSSREFCSLNPLSTVASSKYSDLEKDIADNINSFGGFTNIVSEKKVGDKTVFL
jgi:hypothetical protein